MKIFKPIVAISVILIAVNSCKKNNPPSSISNSDQAYIRFTLNDTLHKFNVAMKSDNSANQIYIKGSGSVDFANETFMILIDHTTALKTGNKYNSADESYDPSNKTNNACSFIYDIEAGKEFQSSFAVPSGSVTITEADGSHLKGTFIAKLYALGNNGVGSKLIYSMTGDFYLHGNPE
jgi:hypothetical protein